MIPPKYALIALLLAPWAGCSHSNPYYGVERPNPGSAPEPPSAEIVQRILLIGDAGEPTPGGEPILSVLADTARSLPDRTAIVFLGDNLYPRGLPADHSPNGEFEPRLQAQVDAVVERARGIFIAGNHDWDDAGEDGLNAIRRQEAFLRDRPRVELLPQAGCPGPEHMDFEGVRLILLDTHWWLHEHDRADDCSGPMEAASVTASIQSLLASRGPREAVVVGHHPLETRGRHGGFYSLKAMLFPATDWKPWVWVPAPAIGALFWWSTPAWIAAAAFSPFLYPLGRNGIVRSSQDLVGARNRTMRDALRSAFESDPPLVYAAGHEHSLQVFSGDASADYLLVSGSGSDSKGTDVGHTDRTLFAHASSGFMALDVLDDGRVLLRVIEGTADPVVYWRWLKE